MTFTDARVHHGVFFSNYLSFTMHTHTHTITHYSQFQSMYRAYVIRKDFIVKMRENLARILAEEAAELEDSEDEEEMAPEAKKEKRDLERLIKEKCAAIMAQGVRMRFLSWKVFVHERVRLKRKSAALIQGVARKYNAKRSFRSVLMRARNANYKFVQAAEMRVDAMKVAHIMYISCTYHVSCTCSITPLDHTLSHTV